MPSITIHPTPKTPSQPLPSPATNPLPQLLQTPSGLAVCEVQGTFNLPSASAPNPDDSTDADADTNTDTSTHRTTTQIGRLVFPLYDAAAAAAGKDDTAWMKRVYLYVGKHQRMTGEVKKLAKPLAILRRRGEGEGGGEEGGEELEVVEIVRFKVLFASRPEPVGGEVA